MWDSEEQGCRAGRDQLAG